MPARPVLPLLPLLGLTLGLAASGLSGCGSADGRADDGRLRVEASFYPLQWMAEQVGGRWVQVGNLTKPGAEPHDLELSPREVAAVQDAGVVVYLAGFQPSVDAAVADASGPTMFEAGESADLDLTQDSGSDDGSPSEAGVTDPHFWLDPTRLAAVARDFAEVLGDRDPDHAAAYRANALRVTSDLRRLDAEMRAGLDRCESRDLVTAHDAFGYLARRYGLTQVPIGGLSAEDEPSPKEMAAVTRYVRRHDVRTIYFETLVSPAVAETVAAESGARTAVLDPIEGLGDESAGPDYPSIMRANLAALRKGQPCR